VPSGWYKAYLDLDQGRMSGHKDLWQGVVALFTLLLLFWLFLFDFFCFLVLLPFRAYQLWVLRDTDSASAALRVENEARENESEEVDMFELVEKRVALLVDGRGKRAAHLSSSEIFLENLTALLVCLGIIFSALESFKPNIPRDLARYPQVDQGATSFQYLLERYTGTDLYVELLFELCFDVAFLHGIAWLFIYFRLVFFILFKSSGGLRWLPLTLSLAGVRLVYFLVAYIFLVFGFACLTHLQCGQRFMQFSSIGRAALELAFLACGAPMHIFEDMWPFEDSRALLALVYIGVFILSAVAIGLHFFTTILLDAYNLAMDPDHAVDLLNDQSYAALEGLMVRLGIPEEVPVQTTQRSASGRTFGSTSQTANSWVRPIPQETAKTQQVELPELPKSSPRQQRSKQAEGDPAASSPPTFFHRRRPAHGK